MNQRRGLTAGQWFSLSVGALVLIAVAGFAAGMLALSDLGTDRRLLADRLDPALAASQEQLAALIDQETGVRGFTLAGEEAFLAPYERGRREEPPAAALVLRLTRDYPAVAVRAAAVREAARAWETQFAAPAIAAVRAGDSPPDAERGRALFEEVRVRASRLRAALRRERRLARARLSDAATTVTAIFAGFAVVLLVAVLLVALTLRRVVVRPIERLAAAVREVVSGTFERRVAADGAREVVELGDDVEAMRARLVSELSALAHTRDDLARSNAELEQFAYVASHDLQEPLRKVAAFTQMLQRRYAGQLDDRADTYIDFAVDGAKRMQDLINDLLAFSRVGRVAVPDAPVDANTVLAAALHDLSGPIEEAGARIEAGDLPTVRGEASLLTLVFSNLIANAIKFHGPDPAVVRVGAVREGDEWRFTITDAGIGIDPQYADRIFVIFQRLHTREAYEGTGIGLAMCRKVIEYHGGRIWLDTGVAEGATFHFTLPAIPEEDPPQ